MNLANSIYNFRQITSTLATGGQPDADQLSNLLDAGYEVVINLGLANAEYSLPDERQLIESKGARYIHLPVNFQKPEISRYFEFAGLLKTLLDKKIFLHCAANKRVSVFLALFRILEERVPYIKAVEELKLVWEPDEVWKAFMDDVITMTENTTEKY